MIQVGAARILGPEHFDEEDLASRYPDPFRVYSREIRELVGDGFHIDVRATLAMRARSRLAIMVPVASCGPKVVRRPAKQAGVVCSPRSTRVEAGPAPETVPVETISTPEPEVVPKAVLVNGEVRLTLVRSGFRPRGRVELLPRRTPVF